MQEILQSENLVNFDEVRDRTNQKKVFNVTHYTESGQHSPRNFNT